MPNIDDARQTYAASLAFVSGRGELPVLLNHRRLLGCGVEVGVKEGDFSEHLLRHWAGAHLISVDPWMEDAAESYTDIANVPQPIHEKFYERTVQRLSAFRGRSTIWRATSLEASERIPHHSLDFVYLDARHDYASVMEDLEAWFDKVRPGGVIAGHDYLDGTFDAGVFGVKSAVDRFFAERGIPVFQTLMDEPWLTWMVEIPAHAAQAVSEPERRVPEAAQATSVTPSEPQLVSLQLGTAGGPRQVQLVLDPAAMSQRIMLECLAESRFYEPETSQFVVSVLRPGDTFVDVGTHVGYFSMLSAAAVGAEGRVISFEPDGRNFASLSAHVRINGFEQVETYNAAVGARSGTAELFRNADNDGGHALWDVGKHSFNALSRAAPERVEVQMVHLDSVLATPEGPRPRVMKIDAEGAEMDVLRGARATLETNPIPYIICEVNRYALGQMGSSETEMRAYMTELGYETHLFQPGETQLTRLGPNDQVETDYVFNLLFRHASAA